MFRSQPGGWNTARQAAFALLPVVIGAAVLVAGNDRPAPGMSRLEATQSVVPAPALEPAEAVAAPALAGAEPVAAGAETPVAAPSEPAASVSAGGPGPAPGAGTGAGTGDAGTGDDSSDDAGTGDAGASAIVAGEVASPASGSSPAASVPASVATTTAPSTSSSTTTPTTTTTTTAPAPEPGGRARDAEAEVVPLTNADRAAAGLGALSRNGCLDAAAAGFAEQMARSGVLAHNPGAGGAVNGCRTNATWGDNVGMSTACDIAFLEREWMASPSHRRNILTGAFTLIGVGAWTDDAGTCWVQVLFSS